MRAELAFAVLMGLLGVVGGSACRGAASAPAAEPSATATVAAQEHTGGLAAASAQREQSAPQERPRLEGEKRYQLELHWGFVDTLGPDSGESALLLPMDGRISIDDGDDSTQEGIHLISNLLFEHGGSYQEGRGDEVILPEPSFAATGGLFYPWIAWRSATTNDWDGMAVVLSWHRGTNPMVAISIGDWAVEVAAEDLDRLTGIREIGTAGQKLEVGRFFTLTYKVYDLTLQWGYDRGKDASPEGEPMFVSWDGSLTLNQGGIRLLRAAHFDRGGSYKEGRDDRILERDDLSRQLAWRSSTLDPRHRPREGEGIAINLVVPRGVQPVVRLAILGQEKEITLPMRFRDIRREIAVDDQGHVLLFALHWCWWKTL